MRKGMLVLTVVLVSLLTTAVFGEWKLSSYKDNETGKTSWYIVSDYVLGVSADTGQYCPLEAAIFISYNDEYNTLVTSITFFPLVDLLNMKGTLYGDMLFFNTWVMWDDKVERVEMAKFTYTAPLMFTNHDFVINKIRNSTTMLIELNFMAYGTVYYVFDLKGASTVIDSLLYNSKAYK